MCGQWSEEGYLHTRKETLKQELELADWKRIIDELAAHQIPSLLIRGGEPFLFPHIIELLDYINSKGMFTSIDTNGTMLKDYAEDLVRIGKLHLTISVDGPEEIHDAVRGVKGCFQKIQEGVARLHERERTSDRTVSTSINFTISPYSVKGLGAMPDIARNLGIRTICIVPYYYIPDEVGKVYECELKEHLGCSAFSWSGFHHDESGMDFEEFQTQHNTYLSRLDGFHDFPYLPLSEEEYQTWFCDAVTSVRSVTCTNVEKLIDIQPRGEANFCVDFPDYVIGNVKEATIAEVWNSDRANRFREYRRKQPLAVCYRCGAKYMSEITA